MLANPNASYLTIGNANIARRVLLLLQDNFVKKISAVFHTPSMIQANSHNSTEVVEHFPVSDS